MRGFIAAALLLIGAVWVYCAATAPFTGTEARRAVIAREMAAQGDWVLPMHGGEPTLTKPPLHYQLQAAAMSAFGPNRFASRLPSLLLTALLCWAFFYYGRRFGRPGAGYAAAGVVLLASHPVIGQFAASAEIDGPFAVWSCLSLLALADAATRERSMRVVLLSGLCGGLAMLSKGPPMLLFTLPAWLPLGRRLGWRAFLAWAALVALPVGVWLGVLELRGTFDELRKVAGDETVGRLSFLTLDRVVKVPRDLLKFVLLLLPALFVVFVPGNRDRSSPERLLARRALAFAGVGGILVLCLFPHRATRYMLPAMAPLIFVLVHGSGDWLAPLAAGVERGKRFAALVIAVGLPVGLAFAPGFVKTAPVAAVIAVAALPWRGLMPSCLALGLAAQLVVSGDGARGKTLPPRDYFAASRAIAEVTGSEAVTAWSYVPSELIWVLGERVRSDEFARKTEIDTPWVVVFDGPYVHLPQPPGTFEVRMRVSAHGGVLQLARATGQ